MIRRSEVDVEPGRLWRFWWISTEPARLLIRLVAERWVRRSALMLVFYVLRIGGHLAIGNAWWTLLVAVWLFTPVQIVGALVAGVFVEVALAVYRVRAGRPHRVALWRLAWKFHRQWARLFADCAAKTARIQGTDGGRAGESRAAVLRPVVDHPRLPMRFWLRWPVVTFRVGVAPGRSFRQFEQIVAAMSANSIWVQAVELEYRTDRSSFGLLHVALADVLAVPRRAPWTTKPGPDLRGIDGEAA